MRARWFMVLALAAETAAANNALILQPHAGDWLPGGYRDVDVLAATEGRPLGAARFDVLISDTQAVRCVAAYGDHVMARGGLVPVSDAAAGTAAGVVRVAAFNSRRPDAPGGTNRVATLRFAVVGPPGATCAIALTNVALWSTAALPGDESAATDPCRGLPVDPAAAELPFAVAGADARRLELEALPAEWQQGRLYPIRLVADPAGEILSGFEAELTFPTNALEVLDVSALDRQQTVTWKLDNGRLRLLGLKPATPRPWPGNLDLATVWLAVRGTPPEAGEQIQLTAGRLFAGPALQSHGWPVADRSADVDRVPPPAHARMDAPPPTNVCLNSEFETPVALDGAARTPWYVGGWLVFDPTRAVVVDLQPTGLLSHAAFATDVNAFASGCVPFVWSDFAQGDAETNGALPLLNVRWRATGSTLQRGDLACVLTLADGIANGLDTADSAAHVPILIRYSPDDMDGDRIPDWWAILHYHGETNVVAGGDTDRDGRTAWDEYVARTDPTNDASFLHLTSVGTASNGIVVRWASVPGVQYSLRRATNLPIGFDAAVAVGIEATDDSHIFIDTNAPAAGALFYHVGVPEPP